MDKKSNAIADAATKLMEKGAMEDAEILATKPARL